MKEHGRAGRRFDAPGKPSAGERPGAPPACKTTGGGRGPGVLGLVLALVLGASAGQAAAAVDAETANGKIDAFHALLIDVMQTPGHANRAAALSPVVPGFFDIGTVSRITLGRTWRELDEVRQREFSELLEALIVATYADRFDSFDGQRFERGESLAGRRGWVVKTQLVRSNGERVNLDYYFNAGSVFNVVADGVSDLSLRRADYNSIVKQDGYDALIRDMQENIAEMRGED